MIVQVLLYAACPAALMIHVFLSCCVVDGSEPPSLIRVRRFNFSRWAVSLNSRPPSLEPLLPPSDMRWRRDVRLLEEGDYEQVCNIYPCTCCG